MSRTIDECTRARRLAGEALREALRDSRRITWSRVADLDDAQWQVPYQAGVNPVAWELSHLAWFAEFWIHRGPHRLGGDGLVHASAPPLRCGPDTWFDSARLPHAERWRIDLPTREELAHRLDAQLEAAVDAVPDGDDDRALYFHRLSLFHEDMHAEAFAWTRATLGLPSPRGLALRAVEARDPLRIDGATVEMGHATAGAGFAFDNEMPSRRVDIAAFEIDARCVTQEEFRLFVEAGGYDDPEAWHGAAARWRVASGRRQPARWRRAAHGWEHRWFDRWIPLAPQSPMLHVNAFEADAYCRWADRRLPRAAEWELAATTAAPGAFDWGDGAWEWTADDFVPYPGFAAGPYQDYSAPWFGDHRELRGGSFATHARLHHPRYRNFFKPERDDVFAGFRTASALALPRTASAG